MSKRHIDLKTSISKSLHFSILNHLISPQVSVVSVNGITTLPAVQQNQTKSNQNHVCIRPSSPFSHRPVPAPSLICSACESDPEFASHCFHYGSPSISGHDSHWDPCALAPLCQGLNLIMLVPCLRSSNDFPSHLHCVKPMTLVHLALTPSFGSL